MNYKVIKAPTGVIVAGSRPFSRQDKVTEELVKDPAKLANTLTRMSVITKELSEQAQKGQSTIFEDMKVVGGAGTRLRMEHGFGRRVMWMQVNWVTATAGPDGVVLVVDSAQTTENVLTLRAWCPIDGTVSVEVF